jgi:hypothetical protein
MSSPLQEAAVESIEVDAFAREIPDLIPEFDTLYSFAKKNFATVPSSNITEGGGTTRPSARVPFRVQQGAPITQGTGDGDGIGRGSGSLWKSFALSPVVIKAANEITWLAKKATEGKERGLFNVSAQELKNSLAACTRGIEGLMNGDGSGAVDQIPTTATVSSGSGSGDTTSYISGLNNVAGFTDQQVITVYPSIGGTKRGNATISYVDPVTNTLWFSTALPSTGGPTAVGDYLMVSGGATTGAASSSILGLRYWQNNGNTGTIAGVNRALYPGRLSTPTINLSGNPVTQSVGLRAATLMGRALEPDAESIKNAVWYTGPDQGMAVSNLMYNVQIVNAQEVKGDTPLDMGKKFFPATFCNRELMISWTAKPGRLDLFTPDTWYIFETAPLELYDFGGGMTVMPVPDIAGTGSYLTSYIMAYITAFNVANSNMLAGCYISSAAQPTI